MENLRTLFVEEVFIEVLFFCYVKSGLVGGKV